MDRPEDPALKKCFTSVFSKISSCCFVDVVLNRTSVHFSAWAVKVHMMTVAVTRESSDWNGKSLIRIVSTE